MTVDIDEERLDDAEALASGDPQQMLRAVATSASQVRASLTSARDAGLDVLRDEVRPRAVVVAGMGGSAVSGDVLQTLAVATSPVPVLVHRSPGLPGWVGAADLVIALSCSGTTRETLAAVEEAVRRGSRLVGVGSDNSPLAVRTREARGLFVPITPQLSPRSSLWALATPVLVAASRLGLVDLGPDEGHLEQAATRLETIAEACRPDRESFVNPAKTLALELAGSLPMVWGAGPTGSVAAYRFGCQLAENAKFPSVAGTLPEAHHNQVVALDGALAGATRSDDLFRDRVDDEAPLRLRLVLLHDDDGSEETQQRVDTSQQIAEGRGVAVTSLHSDGQVPLERLASLVGLTDYASVYLAIALSVDPTPIKAIDELKRSLA